MIMTKALLALIIAMQAIPQEQRQAEAVVPAVGIVLTWVVGEGFVPSVAAGVGLAGAWVYKQIAGSGSRSSRYEEQPYYKTYHETAQQAQNNPPPQREKSKPECGSEGAPNFPGCKIPRSEPQRPPQHDTPPKPEWQKPHTGHNQPNFENPTHFDARAEDRMPPGYNQQEGWRKAKGGPIFVDPQGLQWKEDMKHKGSPSAHWDVSNKKGQKVKEVSPDGEILWPNGNKNKNKK